MELPPYNGSWITCGSYAFLHAAGLDKRHLLSVENSAGATFGMASLQERWDYTRLLTPAFDFHAGIDASAPLWGVELEHGTYGSFAEFAAAHGTETGRYLVGPVNMAGLRYLPLAAQYRCADHYVVLLHEKDGYTLIDSEGVPGLRISEEELNGILTGRGIPESGGSLHIRRIRPTGAVAPLSERMACAVQKGASNLRRAKQMGEGPQAFLKCAAAIAHGPEALWREALSYDLDYVVQRRLMMQRLLESIADTAQFQVDSRLPELVDRQIEITAGGKAALRQGDRAALADCLSLLSETEETLTQQWEVWIHDDRN